MTKILVISDNHGNKKVMEEILKKETYDVSVHLGDTQLSLEWMKKNFTYFVAGNHDGPEFPDTEVFEVEGKRIIAGHGHLFFGAFDIFQPENTAAKFAKNNNANIILFGHSHMPCNKNIGDILCINPGSCALPRNPEGATYAIINIDNKDVKVEHKVIKNQ